MLRLSYLLALCAAAAVALACDDDEVTIGPLPSSLSEGSRVVGPIGLPDSSGWSTGADMPTPRAEVAAAAIDRKIYVVGGFTENGQNSNIVEVYDAETDTWSSIEPMPERLDHAMAASANGKLYVMGGWRVFGEQVSEAVYEYDPATERWQSRHDMELPRAAGAAASDGSTIYVVGGVGPEAEVALAYDADADTWRRIASIAAPREHLAAAVVRGKVYAIGGRWPATNNLATLEQYDPAADAWRELEPMPTARGGIAAAVIDNSIHVVGGESFGASSRTFEEHEVLSLVAGDDGDQHIWQSEDPLPTSRHGLAAVGVDGKLFVIAGGQTPGLSVSGFVEIFRSNDPTLQTIDVDSIATPSP